ncbi:MAG: peptide-methionine (S)-S-oxide reductase [Reichenbachiella sp.]
MMTKIGFGGGCHWCTESVFQSLKGVQKVAQGWIASINENDTFSEAVIVHFDTALIDLSVLIEIHLNTHSSSSTHAMRSKYRSSVYTFEETQFDAAVEIIAGFQKAFNNELITEVYPFDDFKPSPTQFQNY